MPITLRWAAFPNVPIIGPRCRGSLSPQRIGIGFAPDLPGWEVKTMCLCLETDVGCCISSSPEDALMIDSICQVCQILSRDRPDAKTKIVSGFTFCPFYSTFVLVKYNPSSLVRYPGCFFIAQSYFGVARPEKYRVSDRADRMGLQTLQFGEL